MLGIARRNKTKRLTLTIKIPERGSPLLGLDPARPSPYDLALAVLCYGSKVRWLLETEYQAVADVFQEFCGEALDFWNQPGPDLIARMPSAASIAQDYSGPRAAPGGERFVISLFRTDHRALRNTAFVTNALPRQGLSANIPYSFLVVLNAVFVLLNEADRARFHTAMQEWYDAAFGSESAKSLGGLKQLFAASLAAVDAAFPPASSESPAASA